METRKITVVSTANQTKKVINSNATTLAELKNDLRANNISYDDMTFYEGLSRTEILDDASVLPHDITYKGRTTNELVFMLTNTNKKIKSGSLSELRLNAYEEIHNKNLEAKCCEKFGKNFTQCKTSQLLELIEEYSKDEESLQFKASSIDECVKMLVTILAENGDLTINQEDLLNEMLDSLDEDTVKSSYSKDEIDDMFDFVNTEE